MLLLELYVRLVNHLVMNGRIIACSGCPNTVRESAPQVDSGRKSPCHSGDLSLLCPNFLLIIEVGMFLISKLYNAHVLRVQMCKQPDE